MAGSIKIQHGATASTPQAGFTTIWSSTSGDLYYTKPNGNATAIGSLETKNIQFGGTAGWIWGFNDPLGNAASYYDVTYSTPFGSTNYTTDLYWFQGLLSNLGILGWWANSVVSAYTITFSNKTSSGVRIWISGNIGLNGSADGIFNLKATAIGEG